MKIRTKRGLIILGGLGAITAASALVLNAFQDNLVFFFSPSQVAARAAPQGRHFRLGGLVEQGSIERPAGDLIVQFVVTDGAQRIPVRYSGLLPDMFREGKGVVAQGQLDAGGIFQASQVLAKHDENYMPREAADALKSAGYQPPTTIAGARP
jgi:cytochrome c-type biogenesis protein CcmE